MHYPGAKSNVACTKWNGKGVNKVHYKNGGKVIHMLRVHLSSIFVFQRHSQGGFEGEAELDQKSPICFTLYNTHTHTQEKQLLSVID